MANNQCRNPSGLGSPCGECGLCLQERPGIADCINEGWYHAAQDNLDSVMEVLAADEGFDRIEIEHYLINRLRKHWEELRSR